MTGVETNLGKLEKGNSYIIRFGMTYNQLVLITVLYKLENTMLIKYEETSEEKWALQSECIILYDHVPVTYFRKKKLDKINK